MIRHKQFTVGQSVHALMSNSRYTDYLFPIRGVIHDIEWDEYMPRYQLRITKFYDSVDFLKRYLIGFSIDRDFKNGKTKFPLLRQGIANAEDFQRKIDENWQAYLVVVESVYCVRFENEMFDLYRKIQDFFIEKKLREIFELSNRNSYQVAKGRYYYSYGEFVAGLKKLLDKKGGDDKYYRDLLSRPKPKELDNID